MPLHPVIARLGPTDVHIWQIPLYADVDRMVTSLSAAELHRLARCRGERRRRFAISHGAMRQVLGHYLQCVPAAVPLTARYGNAPTVPGLSLSLAHCDQLALLAVSRTPVGVDVEPIEEAEDDDLSDLAEATLAPRELRRFRMAAAGEQPRAWLRLWVRKEAVLKARGEGLTDRVMCDLDVSDDRVGELIVTDIDVGADHIAATAFVGRTPQICMKEWTDESR